MEAGGEAGAVEAVRLASVRTVVAAEEAGLGLVPLDERAAIANHNRAELFVSIHLNASKRRGVVNVGNPAGAAIAAADQYASTALPWGHTTTVEAPGGIVGSTMRLFLSVRCWAAYSLEWTMKAYSRVAP